MASSKQHRRILEVNDKTLTIYVTLSESMLSMDKNRLTILY